MKITKSLACTVLALAAWAGQPAAMAQVGAAASAPSAAAPEDEPGTRYSEKGADTCIGCHDEESATLTFSPLAIFKGKHAQRGNPRSPFGAGGLQCEACHGPGERHSTKGSKKVLTTNSFKASSFMSVAQRNQPCLDCHQDRSRSGWHAGAHERGDLACSDCHKVHVEHDPVLAKSSQTEVCYACHKQQRADFHKTSSHPVRAGRMGCSDCHNPHGSTNAALLIKPTVNQTCFSCHADKRGPLLWEHAPVAEDCSLCHSSHGSVRSALLNKSPPLLCQQCHTVSGHPSAARTGDALPGGTGGGSIFLLAGGCINCHSQVHGSNHPAGAKLMR
ncbi:MAG: DmsE family decaheme c-type cytochrome [Burkholderiaceae bacterium]